MKQRKAKTTRNSQMPKMSMWTVLGRMGRDMSVGVDFNENRLRVLRQKRIRQLHRLIKKASSIKVQRRFEARLSYLVN